jgi:hypothetical protein
MGQGPLPPYSFQEPLSPSRINIPNGGEVPFRRSSSPASSLSEPDGEDAGPDKTAGSASRTASRGQVDGEKVKSLHDDAHATDTVQESAVQLLSAYKRNVDSGTHRTSTLLLQMVPYRPTISNEARYNQSNCLVPVKRGGPARSDTDPKPAMEEATNSVRLLLDKWTTSGSAPVSDMLVEKAAKDSQDK